MAQVREQSVALCGQAFRHLPLLPSWQVQLNFEDLMAWSVNAQAEAYS